MSIKGHIEELEMLKAEISRNNARNRSLRTRVRNIEKEITLYLRAKEQAGVKYRGRTIVLETRERRPAKQKKQKKRDVVNLLESLGVQDAYGAYDQLVEVQRGDPVEHDSVKIRRIKNQF